MKIEPKPLIDEYLKWLRNHIAIASIGDSVEITTPFLDRNNDHIQIYASPQGNGIRLSDDGYTISELETSGCTLDTPRRRSLLETTLNGFGVKQADGVLFVDSSVATFGQKKHALVQAVLAVNDMFMTAQRHVASLFFEDVQAYFDEHDIRYTPKPSFIGQSGFPQTFDFVIPRSRKKPERLISAVNELSKPIIASHLFAWNDTQTVRDPNSEYFIIVNDVDRHTDETYVSALQNYKVHPVLWSNRDESLAELAA
jgi:Domain of unknown function DUF1829/Domain of unknown function DUF1828